MKQKLLLGGLIIGMSMTSMAFASFVDVDATVTNKIAIEYLQKNNVVAGYEDNTYRPDELIRRGEMLKILVEGLGISPDASKYQGCFPDVGSEWYAKYICYAKEKGWVAGYDDKTFKPEQHVEFVEALKMTLNARGIVLDGEFPTNLFQGISKKAWFYPFLVTGEKLNIVDNVMVEKKASRGEVAEMIYRAIALQEANAVQYSHDLDAQIADKPMTRETQEVVDTQETQEVAEFNVTTDASLKKYFLVDANDLKVELPMTYDESAEMEVKVFKVTDKSVYVRQCATGFGGYILFDFCSAGSVYKYDRDSGTVEGIPQISSEYVYGLMDVSPDENGFVWRYEGTGPDGSGKNLFVTTADQGISLLLAIPEGYSSYGDAKFSPDGKRIAYAVAVGEPGNESGKIFIVDVATEEQTEYASISNNSFYHVNGWKDNDTVDHSVEGGVEN